MRLLFDFLDELIFAKFQKMEKFIGTFSIEVIRLYGPFLRNPSSDEPKVCTEKDHDVELCDVMLVFDFLEK